MALYYAPAVFAYLLGRCFGCSSITCSSITTQRHFHILKQIGKLGITVLVTFGILWYPFYYHREDIDQSMIHAFGIILRRIFPFSRYV